MSKNMTKSVNGKFFTVNGNISVVINHFQK